ncbi:hypothetical protein K493DRAFT_317140 [Basidiobolus meristosporus CBS 931.73]|uniref:Dynactin subunit 3 n=1 Tax=Basidiobolus meristosporus CBS 931.73 TaxID=1314790 RepID=A0A1Y1Y0V1_9FUNG|nr:hypothetical protein K493DRAFT_317140 [Basidiobolus meristosporus CBS 931.73]|eukprot:ORX91642.1 hypothetical protein K493DRAFT_317140 [Basidiobolus meristosporus CBS 931.73]
MPTLEKDILALNLRLKHLEDCVLRSPESRNVKAFDLETALEENPNSLLARVEELEEKLRKELAQKKYLADFLQKFNSLKEFLEVNPLDFEKSLLTPAAKTEIILGSEAELSRLSNTLSDIEGLEKFINPPAFQNAKQFEPTLKTLSKVHLEQSELLEQLNSRVTNMLDVYNNTVNTLSEIFLSWDSLLSALEAKVSTLERMKSM